MRVISDKLSDSYATHNSLTKHSAVYEITVFLKPRVIFKQYTSKKHELFGIKLYKLCDSKGYTCNMTVYLGKDRKRVTPSMTTTYATVTGLAARTEHLGHKLYKDNFFSSPVLFDDVHTKTINYIT